MANGSVWLFVERHVTTGGLAANSELGTASQCCTTLLKPMPPEKVVKLYAYLIGSPLLLIELPIIL